MAVIADGSRHGIGRVAGLMSTTQRCAPSGHNFRDAFIKVCATS